MDNHAGNFDVEDLKWLAGVIDSDGCINISKSVRKNNRFVYTPNITITNSNNNIIEYIHNILDFYSVNHHIKPVQGCKNIVISRPNIIVDFYKLIFKYILTKTNELNILYDFCCSRIDNVNNNGCNWKAGYSDIEHDLYNNLSFLNKNHYGECIEYSITESIIDYNILYRYSNSWLAGFIDGDGCITINRMKRPDGGYQYQPMVHIVTGSILSKHILTFYLDRYNINYYLKKQLPGNGHKPNCKSKKFEFYIRSIDDCTNILNIIYKNLHGKKYRAEKLINFCSSRKLNKNKKYSDYELDLYVKIKNDIKGSSTTISKTLFSEDIV